MERKKELKELIELIKQKTGKTQEELSVGMGYGWNYLSDVLAPSKTVSEKLVNKVRLHFKDILEGNSKNTNPENTNYYTKGVSLSFDEILGYVKK